MISQVVDEVVRLLEQAADRERDMAKAYRGVGYSAEARRHEIRGASFDEVVALVVKQFRNSETTGVR